VVRGKKALRAKPTEGQNLLIQMQNNEKVISEDGLRQVSNLGQVIQNNPIHNVVGHQEKEDLLVTQEGGDKMLEDSNEPEKYYREADWQEMEQNEGPKDLENRREEEYQTDIESQ
jgi:hypothetical protein